MHLSTAVAVGNTDRYCTPFGICCYKGVCYHTRTASSCRLLNCYTKQHQTLPITAMPRSPATVPAATTAAPAQLERTPDKASNTNQQLPAKTHQPLQLLLQRAPACATDHCGCCAAAADAAVSQTATTATTLPAGAVGGDGGNILCRTAVQQKGTAAGAGVSDKYASMQLTVHT